MEREDLFVTLDYDNDNVVVIDMDGSDNSDFVMIDNSYEEMDFITLSDDVELVSDIDIVDIDAFDGVNDMDISFIV